MQDCLLRRDLVRVRPQSLCVPTRPGAARSRIAPKSVPAGRVPKARPPSPSRRLAQKASAISGGAWRTSSEAWRARARRSTRRRARSSRSSRLGELGAELVDVDVQPVIAAAGLPDLGEQGVERFGALLDRPQHVQALDVARPFPDRVQRRLAVEARHPPLLHVAVAAQALQRLGGVDRRALAGPVLEHGRRQPPERGLRRVVGAGEAHHRRGGGLGLEREVGEDVAHQRLIDQELAEGPAVRRRGGSPAPSPRAGRRRRRSRSRAACG